MIAFTSTLLIIFLSKNNIISLFISIEILLLIITLKLLYVGNIYNDVEATVYAIYIVILAGAESAIGLSLLVSYYRLRGHVSNIL